MLFYSYWTLWFCCLKCMSTTVCDITVQFSFFLFMRLNIVIDKICDSLIVILSSSLNLENGMKEHVQNVALKINMDLSNFLFLFLLLLFFFTWFRIGFCLWLTLLQPIYSKLESRFIVKSEAPVFLIRLLSLCRITNDHLVHQPFDYFSWLVLNPHRSKILFLK